jgi:hypothetical protein
MTNLLAQAINCNDGDRTAEIIQDALGIESDDVVNYCCPVASRRPGPSRSPMPGCSARVSPSGIRLAVRCSFCTIRDRTRRRCY